jgi:hypothetical protein
LGGVNVNGLIRKIAEQKAQKALKFGPIMDAGRSASKKRTNSVSNSFILLDFFAKNWFSV